MKNLLILLLSFYSQNGFAKDAKPSTAQLALACLKEQQSNLKISANKSEGFKLMYSKAQTEYENDNKEYVKKLIADGVRTKSYSEQSFKLWAQNPENRKIWLDWQYVVNGNTAYQYTEKSILADLQSLKKYVNDRNRKGRPDGAFIAELVTNDQFRGSWYPFLRTGMSVLGHIFIEYNLDKKLANDALPTFKSCQNELTWFANDESTAMDDLINEEVNNH